MKKKMNRMFVVISLVAIILTTGLITVVYYNLFRGQVLADLKDYLVVMQEAAEAAAHSMTFSEEEPSKITMSPNAVRIYALRLKSLWKKLPKAPLELSDTTA